MRYCVPCAEADLFNEARLVIDGQPVCAAHALDPQADLRQRVVEIAASAAAGDDDVSSRAADSDETPCNRGCGRASHRGLCRGSNYRERRAKPSPPEPTAVTIEAVAAPSPAPAPGVAWAADPDDEIDGLTVAAKPFTFTR